MDPGAPLRRVRDDGAPWMQVQPEPRRVTWDVAWRAMTLADLPAVLAVAAQVHPAYPEDEIVFAERLRLAPDGCLCLSDNAGIAGYLVSHPWLRSSPPPLNSLLGPIPAEAAVWYVHDLALLSRARGTGAAALVVDRLRAVATAAGCSALALVAVNDSSGFWQRQGFRVVHDASLAPKLASYDDAAAYMERELAPGATAGAGPKPEGTADER